MKSLIQKYVKICPKSGRIRKIISPKGFYKILFPFIGLAALLWILIRVIPKPSRAEYPCIKAATPLASGFLVYFAFLIVSAMAFSRTKKRIYLFPYFVFIGFAFLGFSDSSNSAKGEPDNPIPTAVVEANSPIGVAKGIFPGRVVWVHNSKAVNQNCSPSALNHAWYMAENNNQMTIDSMVSAAVQNLTGQKSDSASWQAIFQYHNSTVGKGAVNYVAGEKIFIKINACSAWTGNINTTDLTKVPPPNQWYGMSETSPAMMRSVLNQLVNIVHVSQSDIYIGDPMKHIYKHIYDQLHPFFPNVHYLDHDNYANLGREQVVPSKTAIIYYSDRGKILRPNVMSPWSPGGTTPVYSDYLYTIFENAEYMINIPQLKGHMRAGMTLFAKNHFGSQTRLDASHLHNGLVAPMEMDNGDTSRVGYGLYRVQVDLMTQSLLRKKNLVFLLDGLWGTDEEQDQPLKFKMAPFNNTFSSSVFVSFDNVAIESVAYDFLRSEFTAARGAGTFVQMRGVDDYLRQAADSTNWPTGIKYDPDNSGVHIYSLGVNEHWNNATDKKYSRNLGTGSGIELLDVEQGKTTGVAIKKNSVPEYFTLYQNYPNPFNPTTVISYSLPKAGFVTLKVYNEIGQEITTLVKGYKSASTYQITFDASKFSNGVYIYTLKSGNYTLSKKMLLIK